MLKPCLIRLFASAFMLGLLALGTVASARVTFAASEFAASEFQNASESLAELCITDSSFWCGRQQDELTLITSKSMDLFFTDAGELAAIYIKQQRGQNLNNYNLTAAQNLIPASSSLPGGALLLGDTYVQPEVISSSWDQISSTDLLGEFELVVGPFAISKSILVSGVSNTFDVSVDITPLAEDVVTASDASSEDAAAEETIAGETTANDGEAEDATSTEVVEADITLSVNDVEMIRYAFPGIARQDAPVVKIGQGTTFALNPISQPIDNPLYASLQNNNRNTGQAIILRPEQVASGYTATYLPPDVISLGTSLTDGTAALELAVYTGPNELVRYHQEDYKDLPGLFTPNILGRLSLGIIFVLELLQSFIGSWGLSIILLTLFFRLLIWPLMATQTKSMVGMQKIQPKLKVLQEKYKNNREKLTQETMKLYQEAGVNPMGGCLPMVLQMPLFIILWRVFMNFEFNQGFLWIPDLGQADPFYILPIVYVGVMVGQSLLSAKGNKETLRQQLMINVIFVFFIINFPSGVALYLVTSMLVQVGQQYLIQRSVNAQPATT
ncbi:MAG: YidC/Oxa1 family membrane protein insertase [Deinococcota bacterium]